MLSCRDYRKLHYFILHVLFFFGNFFFQKLAHLPLCDLPGFHIAILDSLAPGAGFLAVSVSLIKNYRTNPAAELSRHMGNESHFILVYHKLSAQSCHCNFIRVQYPCSAEI